MKFLKIAGLGIAIWGLSFLWIEVNWALRLPVIAGLVMVWAAATLADILAQRLSTHHRDGRGQDRPTRPIPVAVSR